MDEMLEKLKEYGADMNGTMGRFLDDVELYKSCFTAFVEDDAFRQLGEALETMDYEKAFEHAHTLKGITGNMGLTPLYRVICNMVEDLRKNEHSALDHYYAEIVDQLSKLKEYRSS